VAPRLPEAARVLSSPQRAYLRRVAEVVGLERTRDPEAMQAELYELAKAQGLVTAGGRVSQEAFAAVYRALIGKPSGPRAAWLLVSLDPEFVRGRLREAADGAEGPSLA
jgi:lysyl-tRNA synthetase, class I